MKNLKYELLINGKKEVAYVNPEKLEAKQGNLIPVLVKAIQELSTKVTALEAG